MATTPNSSGYVYVPIVDKTKIAFNQEVAPFIKYKIGDTKYYVDNPNTYDETVKKTVVQILKDAQVSADAVDFEYLFNTGYLHDGENTKYNFEQRAFVEETTIKPEYGHISSEHDKLKNFRERKDGSQEEDGRVLIDVKGKSANSIETIDYKNNGIDVGRNWGYRPRVIWNNWNDTKYIKVLEKRPGTNGKPSLHIIDSAGQEYNIELKPQQEVIIAKQTNVIDLNEIVNKQIDSIERYVSIRKGQQDNQIEIPYQDYKWDDGSLNFPKAIISKIKREYTSSFIPLTVQQTWKRTEGYNKYEQGYFFTESSNLLEYETTIDSHLNFFKLGNNLSQLEEIKESDKISYCKRCFLSNKEAKTPVVTLNLQRQPNGRHKTTLPVPKDNTIHKDELNMMTGGKGSYYYYLQNWQSADNDTRRSNYYYYCGVLYNTPVASLYIKPTSNYYNIKSSDISTSIITETLNGTTPPMPTNFLEDTGDSIFSAHVDGNKWNSQTKKDEFKTIDFLTQTFNLPPHFTLDKENLPYYCEKDGTTIDFMLNSFFLDKTIQKEIQNFDQWIASIKNDIIKGYMELEYDKNEALARCFDFIDRIAIYTFYTPWAVVDLPIDSIDMDLEKDDFLALGHYLDDAKNKVKNYLNNIGPIKDISNAVRVLMVSAELQNLKNLGVYSQKYINNEFAMDYQKFHDTLKVIIDRELKWDNNQKLAFSGYSEVNCIHKMYNYKGYAELYYKMKLKESENTQEQIAVLII